MHLRKFTSRSVILIAILSIMLGPPMWPSSRAQGTPKDPPGRRPDNDPKKTWDDIFVGYLVQTLASLNAVHRLAQSLASLKAVDRLVPLLKGVGRFAEFAMDKRSAEVLNRGKRDPQCSPEVTQALLDEWAAVELRWVKGAGRCRLATIAVSVVDHDQNRNEVHLPNLTAYMWQQEGEIIRDEIKEGRLAAKHRDEYVPSGVPQGIHIWCCFRSAARLHPVLQKDPAPMGVRFVATVTLVGGGFDEGRFRPAMGEVVLISNDGTSWRRHVIAGPVKDRAREPLR